MTDKLDWLQQRVRVLDKFQCRSEGFVRSQSHIADWILVLQAWSWIAGQSRPCYTSYSRPKDTQWASCLRLIFCLSRSRCCRAQAPAIPLELSAPTVSYISRHLLLRYSWTGLEYLLSVANWAHTASRDSRYSVVVKRHDAALWGKSSYRSKVVHLPLCFHYPSIHT